MAESTVCVSEEYHHNKDHIDNDDDGERHNDDDTRDHLWCLGSVLVGWVGWGLLWFD